MFNGLGTIGVAFVRDAETPIVPSTAEIAEVRTHIVQHIDETTGKTVGIPVTAEPGLFVITLLEKPISVSVGISPNTPAIRTAATKIIDDAWVEFGGPGVTIQLSKLSKAIARTKDLEFFRLTVPAIDIVAAQTEVHTPGVYIFTDY